ncbi:hypothetical protein [Salinibius halmophilus]|uniref:hypothetical protein n=1 Tax=Salinibius halmophilus TaxID=1853216 RepID=UPI000E66E228|nr:hypothetical protein [Salinibius halmophilus]
MPNYSFTVCTLAGAFLLSACAEQISQTPSQDHQQSSQAYASNTKRATLEILANTNNGACELTALTDVRQDQYGSYLLASHQQCGKHSATRQIQHLPVTLANDDGSVAITRAYISQLGDSESSTFIEVTNLSGEVFCPLVSWQLKDANDAQLHHEYFYSMRALTTSYNYFDVISTCMGPNDTAVYATINPQLNAQAGSLSVVIEDFDTNYVFAPANFELKSLLPAPNSLQLEFSLNYENVGLDSGAVFLQDQSGYFVRATLFYVDLPLVYNTSQATAEHRYSTELDYLQPGDKVYFQPNFFTLEKVGPK